MLTFHSGVRCILNEVRRVALAQGFNPAHCTHPLARLKACATYGAGGLHAYNYQLQWFTADGQPLRRVGYHLFWLWPRPVSSRAGFFVPTDTAIGPDGIIHVADSGNHRVVMLSGKGEYMAEWRIPDPDPNIFSPEHVAASPARATVYATDLANDRVLILRVSRPQQ